MTHPYPNERPRRTATHGDSPSHSYSDLVQERGLYFLSARVLRELQVAGWSAALGASEHSGLQRLLSFPAVMLRVLHRCSLARSRAAHCRRRTASAASELAGEPRTVDALSRYGASGIGSPQPASPYSVLGEAPSSVAEGRAERSVVLGTRLSFT